MKTKILFILFVTTFFFSCKENTENIESKTETDVVEIEKKLGISISFKIEKADKIRFMMNGIEIDEFQKKNIFFVEDVMPTTNYEKSTVYFDSNNFSRNISINLGDNNDNIIEFKDITFSYGSKEIVVDKNNYDTYLGHNIFVERDSLTNKFKTTKVKDKPFNPLIYVRQTLLNELVSQ
ncbi:MAG: hypothetical protein R2785_07290 [Flavobacteriaceae bacterium]